MVSPTSTSGAGTNYENAVQAYLLAHMLMAINTPLLPKYTHKVTQLSFQKNTDYATDDLVVFCQSGLGQHKLLFQIKLSLSFTKGDIATKNDKATKNDTAFSGAIDQFWQDFSSNNKFDKNRDYFVLVANKLKDNKDNFTELINRSKATISYEEFSSLLTKKAEELFNAIKKRVHISDNNKIYSFLKTIQLWPLDLGNEPSNAKTYLLNQISMCLSEKIDKEASDIYNELLQTVIDYNTKAGSIRAEDLKTHNLYVDYFYKVSQEIENLKENATWYPNIPNKIKDYYIDRKELKNSINESIANNMFTIIDGEAGVGKSAIIKDVLSEHGFEIFPFRAESFDKATRAETLNSLGYTGVVNQLIVSFSQPKTIVFIDSLERLLESKFSNGAFKEFFHFAVEHKIKIIAGCRLYASDTVLAKFDITSFNRITISMLSDEEISEISNQYQELKKFLENNKYQSLLKIPFYLDLTLRYVNAGSIDSTSSLKDLILNSIISKNESEFQRDYKQTFINLAVKRAINKVGFINTKDLNAKLLVKMEDDGLIIKDKKLDKHSLAHDIFEDWALQLYLDEHYDDCIDTENNYQSFFYTINQAPAIRRTFRIWVQDKLSTEQEEMIFDILSSLREKDNYRAIKRDLIIAIFNSEKASIFFDKEANNLLIDHVYFRYCLGIIKTTCVKKEPNTDRFLPQGNIWHLMMDFIYANKQNVDFLVEGNNLLIIVIDFFIHYITMLDEDEKAISHDKLESICKLTLIFIDYSLKLSVNYLNLCLEAVVGLIYRSLHASPNELAMFFDKAFGLLEKEYNENSNQDDFYTKAIKLALVGDSNINKLIIKHCPKIVLKVVEQAYSSKFINKIFGYNGLNSIFYNITPLVGLLQSEEVASLEFIITYLNDFIINYNESNLYNSFNPKHTDILEITLNNGTVKELIASEFLWSSYRSRHGTNGLITSILMALEKYLLDLSDANVPKEKFAKITKYIIDNTNNIMPLGVLVSLFNYNYYTITEEALPILSNPIVYEYDIDRFTRETLDFNYDIGFNNQLNHADKRLITEFHNLKYRKEIMLKLTLLKYQLYDGNINSKIFNMLDNMKKKYRNAEELLYIEQIDRRLLEIGNTRIHNDSLEYELNTKHSLNVQESIKAQDLEIQKINEDVKNLNLITRLDKPAYAPITIKEFKQIKQHKSNLALGLNNDITLAFVALKDLYNELSPKEIKKYYQIALSIGDIPQHISLSINFITNNLHLLIDYAPNKTIKDQAINKIVKLYTLQIVHPGGFIDKLIEYLQTTFYKNYYHEFNAIWQSILQEANYPNNSYSLRKAVRAFLMLPFDIAIEEHKNFIGKIAKDICIAITENQIEKHTHPLPISLEDIEREKEFISYETISKLNLHFSKLCMHGELTFAIEIFNLLLEELTKNNTNKKLIDFIDGILDYIVALNINTPSLAPRFWQLWQVLFEKCKNNNLSDEIIHKLLLIEKYESTSNSWHGFAGQENFYFEICEYFYSLETTPYILKIIATYGKNALLPQGIVFINKIAKNHYDDFAKLMLLEQYSSKQLNLDIVIKECYYNHKEKIIKNRSIQDSFIWLLETMLESGSQQAFMIYDDVITWKK